MPENTKKTTIYDLAELAGTSAGTVSAVINGNWKKRRISEKLAERVLKLAEENGFALNMQARALSREKSGIIGMIVPMYDNRYFSSIAQDFEVRARDAGYFPIVTCTRRDPDLEVAAARAMLGYQVERLICTGATDPDRIYDLCAAAGVPTLNLDLPGTKASSVISDNYRGALELTERLLTASTSDRPTVLFIGGRATDHNTSERIRGFRQACAESGVLKLLQFMFCPVATQQRRRDRPITIGRTIVGQLLTSCL
ncbi:LacI family DNA-binding transcriptional regulator [Yoonia sp. GPGPB17]|uniref:LacI family DNA-binding transcriptional regulator n=1 Tax=Yoonia sp. GPGPB17 TaxID=3026147 RepID=UPI0030C254FD